MPPLHIMGTVAIDTDADLTEFWRASSGRNRVVGGRLFQQEEQQNRNKNRLILAVRLLIQADTDPAHANLPYYGNN